MLNILKKKRNKIVTVVASSLDADLEFSVDSWVKTRIVFDMICRTIGLREVCFFGLAYISKSGYPVWLKLDKKMTDQVPSDHIQDDRIHLQFYAKFYPENIEEELIQDVTRHLFFLQVSPIIFVPQSVPGHHYWSSLVSKADLSWNVVMSTRSSAFTRFFFITSKIR